MTKVTCWIGNEIIGTYIRKLIQTKRTPQTRPIRTKLINPNPTARVNPIRNPTRIGLGSDWIMIFGSDAQHYSDAVRALCHQITLRNTLQAFPNFPLRI